MVKVDEEVGVGVVASFGGGGEPKVFSFPLMGGVRE